MPASTATDTALLPSSSVATEAAIYVHWPFCAKKCPYCDFNSHVRERVDQTAWQQAMVREIDDFAERFPNLSASSIFFGGGTPSLMPPETTAAIIEHIQKVWKPKTNIEITLEANPSSVEAGRFADFAGAGVNRVSIGVQSFRNASLKFLGRLHSAGEAEAAISVARDNFSRTSFDLIYALPEQTVEDWRAELQQALDFSPSHLSLYQLTIEESTAFYHQYKRGKFTLPDEYEATALYEVTQEMTARAGLPAYETSNHARLGEQSQHNLAYWQGRPYVGIGPGAHGRLPSDTQGAAIAHQQVKRPEDWLKAVAKTGNGLECFEAINPTERAIEAIMMGLRLTQGISVPWFAEQFKHSPMHFFNPSEYSALLADGYMARQGDYISLTEKGRPVLNFILQKLLA